MTTQSALEQAAEALRPFAVMTETWPEAPDDYLMVTIAICDSRVVYFTMADCRKAKAALERINDGG